MRQNQKQTQQLPQNPQQQQMQMQQQKMMGPNGPKPMDNKTMGNMQQQMQNLPGQQNKPNQMVIIAFGIPKSNLRGDEAHSIYSRSMSSVL